MVNRDLISLVNCVRADQPCDKIAKNYFNYRVNSKVKIHRIVTMNFFVKVCFVLKGFSSTLYRMNLSLPLLGALELF